MGRTGDGERRSKQGGQTGQGDQNTIEETGTARHGAAWRGSTRQLACPARPNRRGALTPQATEPLRGRRRIYTDSKTKFVNLSRRNPAQTIYLTPFSAKPFNQTIPPPPPLCNNEFVTAPRTQKRRRFASTPTSPPGKTWRTASPASGTPRATSAARCSRPMAAATRGRRGPGM